MPSESLDKIIGIPLKYLTMFGYRSKLIRLRCVIQIANANDPDLHVNICDSQWPIMAAGVTVTGRRTTCLALLETSPVVGRCVPIAWRGNIFQYCSLASFGTTSREPSYQALRDSSPRQLQQIYSNGPKLTIRRPKERAVTWQPVLSAPATDRQMAE